MKKLFFGNKSKNGHTPFWQPWGVWGVISRLLGFCALLLGLILLLGLFRNCGGGRSVSKSDPAWNRPIDRGTDVGLPSPEDNRMPPFDELEPKPNPDNGGATEIYPTLLYVIFNSDADDETFLTFAEEFTKKYPEPEHVIEYYNTGSKTCVLSVPEEERDSICRSLASEISSISFFVIPVELMGEYSSSVPTDPAFSDKDKSWYFEAIQMYDAWGITQGSPDIVVGIVDSFMDLSHPEFQGDRCIYPYSVVDGGIEIAAPAGTPEDSAGHGTLVTAVAVGSMNNGNGSAGIAPNCKFIPVSMGNRLNTITMVEGLLYCIYHGADVINLSCGAMFTDEILSLPLERQIQFSREAGIPQELMWDYIFSLADERNITIVWAAGNVNCFSAMDASKRNANTIRVSAVDRNLKKAGFSNFGNFPKAGIFESTISAPGVDIWGALPNNSYDAWSGTSFAAPIITGVVALIKSQNKDLTTSQIIQILQDTGKPVAGSPEIGNLVQVNDALVKAKSAVSSALTR